MNSFNDKSKNINNVKPTWENSKTPYGKISPSGDQEYLNLWKEYFSDFTGNILEIGAGNGFLAKNILEINKDINYTILDLEAHFEIIKKNVGVNVSFIKSSDYESIFLQNWDLLIETHCLSETPNYYYTNIFDNLLVKNCFVIDYGNVSEDPDFQPALDSWFEDKFQNKNKFTNTKLLGGSKKPIPVYIGKQNDY